MSLLSIKENIRGITISTDFDKKSEIKISYLDFNHSISQSGDIKCEDNDCKESNCTYIKSIYDHFMKIKDSMHVCDNCDITHLYIQQHAINCSNENCKIPMCINYNVALNHIESISKYNRDSEFNIESCRHDVCIATDCRDGKILIKHDDYNNRTQYVKDIIAHRNSIIENNCINSITHQCEDCEILDLYCQQHALHCYDEDCTEPNCIYYRLFFNHVEELENSRRFCTPTKKRKVENEKV